VGLTGMETIPDRRHIKRMTKVKKTLGDADPKAVESWDNEGGAPASGDQSSVKHPKLPRDTNQPAKLIVDGATGEASKRDYANWKSMASVELTEVEQHPNGRLLYSICVQAPQGRMELPIAVEGTAARNEEAALRSTLRFAEDLAESVRRRLGLRNSEMKNHT
jgi:hypothetical protein